MLLCLILASCGSQRRASQVADSVERDSRFREHVIDSVAGSINTDSLYHAYRSMLSAEHPEKVLPLVACIEHLLMWRYGMYPADRAIERMRDTLWLGVEPAARAMIDRLPSYGAVGSNDSLCGPFGSRGRLVVDGVPLDPMAGDSAAAARYPPPP